MKSTKLQHLWPWILGGCSILVVLACLFTTVFGVFSLLGANRAGKTVNTTKQQISGGITPKTAQLQNLQGWVEFQTETGDWSPAMPDLLITAGQHVRTGKLSSASLLFNDGSQANLLADSEIALNELNVQKSGKARTIVMTQVSGESNHQVIPNKRSDSRYEVLTPSGAGLAKGTEFRVVLTPEQTAYYYVLDGVVAVSGMNTTVLVNPGFMTILYASQPPLVPVQTISVEGLVSKIENGWIVAGSSFTVNEKTVLVGSPQIGDWVITHGHIDQSDQNVADWIILLHTPLTNRFSLTGSVEAAGETEWMINGQTIAVSATTDIAEGILVGDVVRVAGLVGADGSLQADQIERLEDEEGLPFQFNGIVQQMMDSTWTISNAVLTTNAQTTLSEGLTTGDLVAVKGWILTDGSWLAKSITLVESDAPEFKFYGTLESKDPWKAAGISFVTRDYTSIPSDLNVGDLVRVAGEIDANGVWIAAQIERIDADIAMRMVLIGTVMSIDPWIVSGITLNLAPDAVFSEDAKIGMLVRVEMVFLEDGTWQTTRIDVVNTLVWFPGCMDIIATVVSIDGKQIQLLNWPVMTVAEDATIEGLLAPSSIIRMRLCFDEAMLIKITYILIIETPIIEIPAEDEGGKVTVCHKPGKKKGGHTLSVGRSALGAHLGHGDYEGACR